MKQDDTPLNGRLIKRLRDARGLTQGQLAVYSGVDQSLVSRLESGAVKNTKISTVRRLADTLGVSVDDLMSDVEITPSRGLDPAAIQRQLETLEAGLRELREMSSTSRAIPTASPAIRVPVLGRVPAGPLMEAIEEAEEHFEVAASQLVGIAQPFMVVVRGESMEPNLHHGEYVLIDPDRDHGPNDIYLVRYDGETAIKRLRIEGEMLVLVSDNPAYQDIRVNNAEAHVVGVAVRVYSRPRELV